jgi:suppressor of fused-like protein
MSDDSEAPGWDAIDRLLRDRYPGQTPLHMAPGAPLGLGAGVQGISAYRQPDNWHLITYGLSELYAKESDDPATSGFGYELTIRVPAADLAEPPAWPFTLLDRVAQAQHRGSDFGVGHRLSVGGPITGAAGCRLSAIAFTRDPELGRIDTPNGALTFVQVVGITAEDLAEMQATSTGQVLERMAVSNPLLITDPAR